MFVRQTKIFNSELKHGDFENLKKKIVILTRVLNLKNKKENNGCNSYLFY